VTRETFDDATEALLSRIEAIGAAANADGWLELPRKVEGALATARSYGVVNTCFDLTIFENMIATTIRDNERRVREYGSRYRPIDPARVRRLREWSVELTAVRHSLTAIVQAQSNADAAKRDAQRSAARGGMSW
jgi:hypothetical protein